MLIRGEPGRPTGLAYSIELSALTVDGGSAMDDLWIIATTFRFLGSPE